MKSNPCCRCCLSEDCYKDMRNEYYFGGQKEVYYDMLINTFQIKVKHNFWICEKCVLELRRAAAFKQQVLHAEQAMFGRLPSSQSLTPSSYQEDDFLDHITGEFEDYSDGNCSDPWPGDDNDKNEETNLLVIKLNEKVAKNEKNSKKASKVAENTTLTSEPQHLYDDNDELNSCHLDDFALDADNVENDRSFLKSTVHAKQPKKKLAAKPNQKLKPKKSQTDIKENTLKLINNSNLCLFDSLKTKFRCFYCKDAFFDIKELRQHSLKHDQEKNVALCIRRLRGLSYKCVDISSLFCKLCGSNLENLSDLQTHLTDLHDIEFSNKEHLLIPYRLETGFQCVICQEDFNTFYRLSIHMNSHYTNNVCEICGLSYINRLSLRSHVHSVHKEKKCSKCSATFFNNYARAKHMRKAHNFRSSVRYCLLCNKTFPYTYMLIEHKIQEHGVKRKISECGECGKTFLTAQNLKLHTRSVHMRERNHQCTMCGMGFFTRCDQIRHQKTHQEHRSFACNYCEGRFKSKDSLRRHLKRQHGHAFTGSQVAVVQ